MIRKAVNRSKREALPAGAEATPAARANTRKPADGGTFTRYVRALAERGEELGDLAEKTMSELRDTLIREMRKRSLWSSPPSYVGIYGCPYWRSRGPSPPLDGLLSECYVFIFCDRLPRLLAGLKVNNAIDGLVVFYVRNFLFERQKAHDPLGYRVFENARAAVRQAVAAGQLDVLKGDAKIRNDTVLGVTAAADPAGAVEASELPAIVARWIHDLLPDLVVAEGAERRRVTAKLRAQLLELEAEGVEGFRFKDLVDALKQDVRARWAGLYQRDEGDTAVEVNDDVRTVVRLFLPATRLEDLDSFKRLVACVAGLIESLGGRWKTRTYLTRLWRFLRRFAVDDEAESLPSNRRLGQTLEIPRDRFSGLYQKLGQLIRRCQATLAGDVVELAPERHRDGGGGLNG